MPSLKRRILHGAGRGALMGLGLLAGEAILGMGTGWKLPTDECLLLGIAYVAALAAPGAALAATGIASPGRWLVALLFFAYQCVVALQGLLPEQPLLSPRRLALVACVLFLTETARRLAWRAAPSELTWAEGFTLPAALSLGAFAERIPDPALQAAALLLGPPVALVLATTVLAKLARASPAAPLTPLLLGAFIAATVRPRPRDLPQPAGPVPEGRPNIVLIVLDTVRARSLSLYGHDRETTPRLAGFARDAVTYTRCLSPATWTLPSHASMFTGLLSSRHGARWARRSEPFPPGTIRRLSPQLRTLAELLSDAGYATAAVVSNSFVLGPGSGPDRGFRYYDARPIRTFRPLLALVQQRLPISSLAGLWTRASGIAFCRADEITAQTRAWLARRPRERPYFLFVNYLDAHPPWALRPGPGWARLRPGWPADDIPVRARADLAAGRRGATPEEVAHLDDRYDDAIAFLDQHVGILLEALQHEPDYQRTLIVVTSDHGEALGEHSSLGHGSTLYGEVLDVPLIVREPGGAPGRVDDTPVQTMDLFPTLLQAAGLPVPPDSTPNPSALAAAPCSQRHSELPGARRCRTGDRSSMDRSSSSRRETCRASSTSRPIRWSSTTSLRSDQPMLPASEHWSRASICDPPHRRGRPCRRTNRSGSALWGTINSRSQAPTAPSLRRGSRTCLSPRSSAPTR